MENVRQLQKELKLYITLISAYIPDTYVDLIEKYVCWNDENGEWQLKCIAYTGNNMRSRRSHQQQPNLKPIDTQLRPLYLSYSREADAPVQPFIGNGRPAFRPKSAMK